MDPTGIQDAFTVLVPSVRKGLTVIPLFFPINLFQSILVCSGISFFATSSLLISLAYKGFKDYVSRRPGSQSPGIRGNSIHTQGYFWLVNLFIAGIFVRKELSLMFRLCAKSWTCSCWGPFASQLCPARVSLHSPRVLNQLRRHRICDLVIRYRRTYVFLACWWTRMESMGG